MAITFTNARYFQTDVGHKIFQNSPQASQWFKILVTSKSVVGNTGQTGFLSKIIFDIWHQFIGLGDSTTIPLRFVCTNSAGSFAQSPNMSITLGVVYGIAVTWDGVAGSQKVWINGVPTQFGTFTGNTQDNSSPLQIGVGDSTIRIVYALDDHNVWDNYLLTSSDIASLLNGTDPTTIGTGATWRGRWTMSGTTGANATIGDAGLKNAFGGGGSLGSGGDGSDCITSGGAGTAVYAPSLVWAPSVGPDAAYIDTSGKVAVVFFKSLVNGSPTTPSQILTIPTISQNAGAPASLGTPWFTGYPFAWFPLPSGMQIAPSDTVTLSAPTAWANTPGGSVEAMNNLAVANRVGKSVVRPDDYVPTLAVGLNNPQSPMAEWGFYYPFKNWKYRTYGGKGKYSGPGTFVIYNDAGGVNGIDNTAYPGAPGLWLVMWDTGTPANVNQFGITAQNTSTTAITERMDLKSSPGSGTGMCRVFDVEHVSLTGSADLSINLTVSGTVDYSNLWIVRPGDFSIVGGAVVLDRSDPYVLSNAYLDRVPQNVGSMRWVDSTIGGDPTSLPYPENRRTLAWESWGDISFQQNKIGFSQVGPVDPAVTPYIYHALMGKPNATGQTFTATLATPISTTPAVNTQETYTFSDAATAPLIAGLEIQIDSEFMRIISVSGTSVVVNRGSNGTTPATHAAGTVTVYGRIAITDQLTSGGGTYFPGANVFQMTTATPHKILTGTTVGLLGTGVAYPTITFTNGDVLQLFNKGGIPYITGPNTFFQFVVGTAPGGSPTTTTSLDPSKYYWDQRWPQGATMPHEACAIVTGKFPNANLHINLWPDACDDMVYRVARGVLANFPAGRKVYVEYNNEPWNQFFGTFTFHSLMAFLVPQPHYTLSHYSFRAVQVHDIFRNVFTAAGRGSEIVAIFNCHNDSNQHLNYAISVNQKIDAVAIAPYVSTALGNIDQTVTNGLVNSLSDEHAISMFVHDLWYNPGYPNSFAATDKGYIQAYNTATGNSCILMGYEGGVEFVIPNNTSIANRETRNHDCVTHPNFYIAEQDFYAWLQMQGFDHLHVYALAMFWAPAAWGMYHGVAQDHGRGDGTDGKFNNLLCRANPLATHYKGTNVNQDMNTVSVRGQAFVDWLGTVGTSPPPPATAYTVTAPTPASGLINTASGNFTVQPNGPYTGTITITPSGGGLSTPMVRTWANSSAPQTFVITPTVIGTVMLTLTNSGSLTDIGSLTYQCTAAPPPLSRAPWWGAWFGRWFAAGSSTVLGKSNPTSATGGVGQGGASAVSFLDVDAPRLRHRFVPWSRRSYRTRGR